MVNEKLLRLHDVCAAVGMRKGGVYKAIREGRFPAPVKLGERAVAWPASAVQNWIAARVERSSECKTSPADSAALLDLFRVLGMTPASRGRFPSGVPLNISVSLNGTEAPDAVLRKLAKAVDKAVSGRGN